MDIVGVIKIAEDSDFEHLRSLVDNNQDWKLDFTKNKTNVWTKVVANTDFKLIKITTVYPDVTAHQLYDVLHDPEYRKVWDHHMIDAVDIGYLNPNNDIGYYSMSCAPLKNRDFVLQRSWLDKGDELLIFNHSVNHKDYPPFPNFVRAISFLTGFVIRSDGANGCTLGYLSQVDPKSAVPAWIVNKVTEIFAPKMIKSLHEATIRYDSWKAAHDPNFKPWYYPEQLTSPRITIRDCLTLEELKELTIEQPKQKTTISEKKQESIEVEIKKPSKNKGTDDQGLQ